MNDDIFVQIFSGLDEEFVGEANEDMNFWLESQKGVVVRADGSRRFPWRTVIASVACTAAALFGVFVLMLNVGKIRVIDSPESSVNSPAQSDVTPDLPADAVLYDEAAYAYEGDSSLLKRYAVGDKFGENTVIKSAKATYKSVDGKPVLLKQEIVLDGHLEYKMDDGEDFFETDENYSVIQFTINTSGTEELGLPRLGDNLAIKTIHCSTSYKGIEVEVPANITMIDPIITVDYETESLIIEPHEIFFVNDNYSERLDFLEEETGGTDTLEQVEDN